MMMMMMMMMMMIMIRIFNDDASDHDDTNNQHHNRLPLDLGFFPIRWHHQLCIISLTSIIAASLDLGEASNAIDWVTLQGINISHLGKRKIIFKYALSGGYVNSLEGI